MASAMACDPSICFSMGDPQATLAARSWVIDEFVGFRRGGDVGCADLAWEGLLDRPVDAVEADETGQRGKCAEQRGVRKRAADMFHAQARSPARDRVAFRQDVRDLVDMEFGEGLVGVDHEAAVRAKPRKHIDHLEKGRVLHDQAIGLHDRLAQPDLLIGDPAKGYDRRAGSLGAEAWKGLRVAPFEKGGNRQHFRACNDALTAAAMDADLEHSVLIS